MTETKKKYLLFKKDDGRPDAMKPCAFFLSPAGCKNGTKCTFSHSLPPTAAGATLTKASVSKPDGGALNANQAKEPAKPMNKRPLDPTEDSDNDSSSDDSGSSEPTQPSALSQPQAPMAANRPVYSAHSPAAGTSAQYAPTQQHAAGIAAQFSSVHTLDSSITNHNHAFVSNNFAKQTQPSIPRATTTPSSNQKKSRRLSGADEDDTTFLFSAVNHALQGNQIVSPTMSSTPSPSVRHNVPNSMPSSYHDNSAAPNMWSQPIPTNMPYSVYQPSQLQTTSNQIQPTSSYYTQNLAKQEKKQKQRLSQSTTNMHQPAVPAIVNTTNDRNWHSLVQHTMNHPRYQQDYNFTSDSSWVRAKPAGEWSLKLPSVLAMDCEMCEITDPVTNECDPNSLIRVSLVDGQNPSNVILDVYLMPSLPITDMKTNIHGITEERLRNGSLGKVATSLRQIQATILNLLSADTIIVGHALYNDFKALRLIHNRVIDTSYLYTLDLASNHIGNGMAYPAPSLREISQHILNFPLPQIHDAIQDAQVALRAALFILEHGPQPPILRISSNSSAAVTVSNGPHTLLVHRIPDEIDEAALQELFVNQTFVVPHIVQKITGRESSTQQPSAKKQFKGKCVVVFTTKDHANLAFDSITGPVRPDNQNKPQKRVYLAGGGYIAIRKNE